MIQLLYADSSSPQSTAAPSSIMSLMPLLFIFVIFYFLLIRPQQKKLKDHKKMIENVKIGDMVITSSGFYATIVGIGETTLEAKIADNVKIKILKSSVSEILNSTENTAQIK